MKLGKVLIGEFNVCNNSRLLFTGTDDSLMYEIKTEDIYEDFSNNKEMLEFSNCLTKSKCYDDLSKLIIGKMKDEVDGIATNIRLNECVIT